MSKLNGLYASGIKQSLSVLHSCKQFCICEWTSFYCLLYNGFSSALTFDSEEGSDIPPKKPAKFYQTTRRHIATDRALQISSSSALCIRFSLLFRFRINFSLYGSFKCMAGYLGWGISQPWDLCLHATTQAQNKNEQISIPGAIFEPITPVLKRFKTMCPKPRDHWNQRE